MACSPSNFHSEPAKIEQIITEFFAKSLHIILESRSPFVSSRNYSGELTSSPSSSFSSSSVRPRDKWFNLALRECPAALENLDLWRQSNLEPLVVDVILVRRTIEPETTTWSPMIKRSLSRNLSARERLLHCSNSGQDELQSELRSEKVIERWVLQYESRKSNLRDFSMGNKKTGGSSSHSSEPSAVNKKTYKKSIILLRSLYVMIRILPAYKLFRNLNSSGRLLPFSLAYRVSSFVEPFTRKEDAEMQHYGFVPVDTFSGRLCLSVSYLPTLSDVNSEPSTPMSPQLITDYVGSPTTDPLKRFPCLPLPGLLSPSPGPTMAVPFWRRHSWGSDLHRFVPSVSPSPSPTYSDSHALPSNLNSNCLPPQSCVNMDVLPPLDSLHHPPETPSSSNVSLAHKKNTSFDEYWPSPPFSLSPSPSPPTYLPSGHLSNALFRSESAPVRIPSAKLDGNPNLPSHVLPPSPSPSPKGRRSSYASHTDNVKTKISQTAVSQSSPAQSKYLARQDSLRAGEFQTGVAAQRSLYFGKDEAGHLTGAKTSNSSPRISFSRSSSRLSFQDDFDDCEFACPFADDDDVTDPRNRMESFDGKGNENEALESRVLLPVRKSQDAALGALFRMLRTAPPLLQDCSNSAKFLQSSIQADENLDPGAGHLKDTVSGSGIMSSTFLMSRTIADSLEELKSYRETKDQLLKQASSQSLDPRKL